MKKRKMYGVISVILLMVFAITACSAKKDFSTADMSTSETMSYEEPSEAGVEAAQNNDLAVSFTSTDADGESDFTVAATSGSESASTTLTTQDKIIRTFFLDVETQEFDSLITQINSEISRLQGYVESSDVSGKSYYSEGARYASIVARIPSTEVNGFVNSVNTNANANVVNKTENTENVSLQYIEAESRVETLKIEQERLYAILEKESSLENIITLESRLSEIRYDLENYESQLRYYDNQVEFSTVTLSIQEVEKLTAVTEVKQSVGTRIKNGFGDTIYNLSEGFKDFFVWFVVNLPYLLIWGIIIGVITLVVRKIMKKQKAERKSSAPCAMDYVKQNVEQPGNSENQK